MDLFDGADRLSPFHPATRAGGLDHLKRFAPKAGAAYAAKRNYDLGADSHIHVSQLSPFIRHRLISEEEVLAAVLEHYVPSTTEKFVQEVFWRSYWKGWLEQRPDVWRSYLSELAEAKAILSSDSTLRSSYTAAIEGRTGIDAFDHWAQELLTTGYLHNHARMWFASIWIFTLKAPWVLGADFFYRHLLDGDPASNTLSWRWVAGLQTKGKTYLARRDNIARYTNNRFAPEKLATSAPALEDDSHPPLSPIPAAATHCDDPNPLLLITEEDLSAEQWIPIKPGVICTVQLTNLRGTDQVSRHVMSYVEQALEDAAQRAEITYGLDGSAAFDDVKPDVFADYVLGLGYKTVVTAYAPIGPISDWMRDMDGCLRRKGGHLLQMRRPYDDVVWPKATKGFFALKTHIPKFLDQLSLTG